MVSTRSPCEKTVDGDKKVSKATRGKVRKRQEGRCAKGGLRMGYFYAHHGCVARCLQPANHVRRHNNDESRVILFEILAGQIIQSWNLADSRRPANGVAF